MKMSRRIVRASAAALVTLICLAATTIHYRNVRRIPLLGMRWEFQGEACLVMEVAPGLAADRAGLQYGDRILRIGGRMIVSPKMMEEVYRRLTIGDALLIEYQRGGKVGTASMTADLFHYGQRYLVHYLIFIACAAWSLYLCFRLGNAAGLLFACGATMLGAALAFEHVQVPARWDILFSQSTMMICLHLWAPLIIHLLWNFPKGLKNELEPVRGAVLVVYGVQIVLAIAAVLIQIFIYLQRPDIHAPTAGQRSPILLILMAGLTIDAGLITILALRLVTRGLTLTPTDRQENNRLFLAFAAAVLPALLQYPLTGWLHLHPSSAFLFKTSILILPLHLGLRLIKLSPDAKDGSPTPE